ncbi:hypothetical protein LTR66_000392 [Elasticomyces elasticus]|nr:hypothetical protein LTR50_006935 [Elasticomyces elasticus]KAK5000806.1 hypothetical protein LTR66_000392 [Elasticomyces elasticus]
MDSLPPMPSLTPEDNETISEAIGNDHKAFDQCYDALKAGQTLADKIKWRNQLTWTIARHAISEELTMYPAMDRHMGEEGRELTDVDREQHQAVKEDLHTLQDMSPDHADFMPLLDKLMADLHHHISHESEEDMPRLERLLSRQESRELARQFRRTKWITPTMSHPAAPNEPPLENLAGLLAAPIDRFKDLMRTFPDKGELSAEQIRA